jgi:hypothetical protein
VLQSTGSEVTGTPARSAACIGIGRGTPGEDPQLAVFLS